ncbi:MAG: hypothetical protein R2849_05590 [Thermomicrobiales bacterium]
MDRTGGRQERDDRCRGLGAAGFGCRNIGLTDISQPPVDVFIVSPDMSHIGNQGDEDGDGAGQNPEPDRQSNAKRHGQGSRRV